MSLRWSCPFRLSVVVLVPQSRCLWQQPGAVISGLLALAFCGDDLAGPVSALNLLASATGATALLGLTLTSGRTGTPRHQRDQLHGHD